MMNNKKLSVKDLAMIGLMAAVTCVLGPLSVPIGPVPISLTNLVILLSIVLLGTYRGTLSYLIYLLLGLVGLPVFSGFSSGPAKLFGPTGGYIVGFIFLALISGVVIDKFPKNRIIWAIGMVVATVILYAFGTVWFVFLMKGQYTYLAALGICVFPFIPGDLAKIAIAILVGAPMKKRLASFL